MRFRHACFVAVGLLPVAVSISAGCSAGSPNNSSAAGGEGGSAGSTNGGSAGSTSVLQGGSGGQGGGLGGVPGTGGIETCAGISAEASAQLQPADIIIAVDTSGSMDEESADVQQNLNNFASIITGSGIDVHVVLIADSTVCIPAPLGSGQCNGADEKLPAYRHVLQTVNSSDGLEVMLATYPQWKDSLRPTATKTLAIVSDDESNMSASAFTNALLALDPPTFQGFKFDAIVASSDTSACFGCIPGCNGCAGNPCCYPVLGFACESYGAAEGKIYKQLVQQTMGVAGDLCLQDFAPVFQDMATAVVQSAQLSCEYEIPPPPQGEMLDPTKVNVNYTPSGQPEMPILFVSKPADCGVKGGWYYDDPNAPTKILMCPTTCDVLKADSTGKIDVLFGCETVIKPPE